MSNQPVPDNPLNGRVCVRLAGSGIVRYNSEDLPPCAGRLCAEYESCICLILEAKKRIEELQKQKPHSVLEWLRKHLGRPAVEGDASWESHR